MHFVWKWPGMMVGALAAAQLSSAEAAAVVPEPSCRHCTEFGSPEFRPVVVLYYLQSFWNKQDSRRHHIRSIFGQKYSN